MTDIQPIETNYHGYRFRSRLEARWAVFFETIGVSYDYEPEGFELGEGLRYLPDFFLPKLNLWVEIKPGEQPQYWGHMAKPLTDQDTRPLLLASKLAEGTKQNVLILYGNPRYSKIDWMEHEQTQHYSGLMFYGAFGANNLHRDNWMVLDTFESIFPFLQAKGFDAPEFDDTIECARQLIEMDRQYYMREYGSEHPKWKYGITLGRMRWFFDNGELYPAYDVDLYNPGAEVEVALNMAQRARFEHGEQS